MLDVSGSWLYCLKKGQANKLVGRVGLRLSSRKEKEANGIIHKSPDPANGRRSIYRLTEKGIDLLPVIVELNHWMLKWDKNAMPCSERLKSCEGQKAKIIAERMKELRKVHLAARA